MDGIHDVPHQFCTLGFLVYISIVIVSALSVLATIKGSLANKVRNQLRFSRQRQKRLILVRNRVMISYGWRKEDRLLLNEF